jgi:Ca2+-binding EF-hand superfamily protein
MATQPLQSHTAEELEIIRNLFHAVTAGITGGATKHLPVENLVDLCKALNESMTSEEIDRAKQLLSDEEGNISFDQFIEYWTSEDAE